MPTRPDVYIGKTNYVFVQGRDIFAPVAAHLAYGVALRDLGASIDPVSLRLLDLKYASRQEGRVEGHIVYIDHFGNLITNIPTSMVPDLFSCAAIQLTFCSQQTVVTERRRFFAENSAQDESVSRPFIYVDSADYVGVAIQSGNAAATLEARVSDAITLAIIP